MNDKEIILTDHYRERVAERLNGVDAELLASACAWAIRNPTGQFRYLGRNKFSSKETSRRFAVRADPSTEIVVVVNDDNPNILRFLTAYTQ